MTKPGHSESEDEMESAFGIIVIVVIIVLALICAGGYWLVNHLLNNQFIR